MNELLLSFLLHLIYKFLVFFFNFHKSHFKFDGIIIFIFYKILTNKLFIYEDSKDSVVFIL